MGFIFQQMSFILACVKLFNFFENQEKKGFNMLHVVWSRFCQEKRLYLFYLTWGSTQIIEQRKGQYALEKYVKNFKKLSFWLIAIETIYLRNENILFSSLFRNT